MSVTLLPHDSAELGFTDAVGAVLITTVTGDDVPVHPPALVAVTVYVPLSTCTDCEVNPLLQR